MAYIEIKNIDKSFGKKKVLKNVSFRIDRGDRFGLIGPNGAGKSTLIDIIVGLRHQDVGEIIVDGLNTKKDILNIRSKIGFVPQDIALVEDLNATDNLRYFGVLYGLSGAHLKARIDDVLELVGLQDRRKEKLKKYSGGMKRRMNIACALLHEPEFLILDEPTVGVDPQSRNYIFEFLRTLSATRQTTLLYTSHYMEEVEALCNRIFLIDEGSEVAYGSKQQITAMVGNEYLIRVELEAAPDEGLIAGMNDVVLGIIDVGTDITTLNLRVDPNRFRMMHLITYLEQQRIGIRSVQREETSLEEAFLRLTGKTLRD